MFSRLNGREMTQQKLPWCYDSGTSEDVTYFKGEVDIEVAVNWDAKPAQSLASALKKVPLNDKQAFVWVLGNQKFLVNCARKAGVAPPVLLKPL